MSSMLDFLRRISGISTPLGGLEWDNEPSEREIVYEMLQALGNRRLIRVHHGGFEYKAVLRSCEIIREDITNALKKLRPESGARICLEEMRGAIHIFQTLVEERYPPERFSYDRDGVEARPDDEVLATLYALKDFFGERLSLLGFTYGIALPQDLSYQYKLAEGKIRESRQIPGAAEQGTGADAQ
jgi:hypothetical protein